MENYLEQLIMDILKKNGNSRKIDLSENTMLREDLGLDSIDMAEMTVRIENDYNIDIFEDGVVNTIGEILDKLKKHE